MVRRSLILLITLLALQFSWSVVAGYCTHETGRAAKHLGHHPDTTASQDEPADGAKNAGHSHCASCAHGTLSIDSFVGLTHPPIAEAPPVSTDVFLSPYYTAPPERPQWAAAA